MPTKKKAVRKINKKNFERVIKIIQSSLRREKLKKEATFQYQDWFFMRKPHDTVADVVKHPCGTAGCVGGWGCVLAIYDKAPNTVVCKKDPEFHGPDEVGRIKNIFFKNSVANKFFGITEKQGEYLYYGEWHGKATDATTKDVLAKLKNIIKTGKVINPKFDAPYQNLGKCRCSLCKGDGYDAV